MLIAGDFNSRTNMAPYYLLHNGALSNRIKKDLDAVGSASVGGQSLFSLMEDVFSHAHPDLTSSYLTVKGSEPEVTNYDE